MKIRHLAGVATGLCLVLAGCGGGGSTDTAGGAPPAPPAAEQRSLTVLAAASLTESFDAVKARFETDNPGVTVQISYAGSSDLAQQIVNGAPVDVFASASDATMKTVTDVGLAEGAPTIFATNVLQIATVPGNPKGVASFADLARPDLKVVVCAPQVPCGSLTEKIERATGVTLTPVSEESDVKSVTGKVASGDADAGLVYVTDVGAAGDQVEGVDFPESAQAVTNYPIAVLTDAPQAELAARFQEVVLGEFGQKTLTAAGFGGKG